MFAVSFYKNKGFIKWSGKLLHITSTPLNHLFSPFSIFLFVGILHVSCKIVNNTNWHIWNVGVIWVRFLYSSSEIWIYYDFLFWYHDSSTSENFVPVLSKLQQKQERLLLYSYKHLIFFPMCQLKNLCICLRKWIMTQKKW